MRICLFGFDVTSNARLTLKAMSNYKTIAVIGKYHARSRSYRFLYPRPNPTQCKFTLVKITHLLALVRISYMLPQRGFIFPTPDSGILAPTNTTTCLIPTLPHPTLPHPTVLPFMQAYSTRRVNENRVVTEPKQPGVHDYSEKGRNFVGDFPFS